MNTPVSPEKDTLILMTKYNFRNPYNVEIIFDEDDNDENNVKTYDGTKETIFFGNDMTVRRNEFEINQVAKNMAYILDAYIRISNTPCHGQSIALKQQYLKIKCHSFNRCLAISETLLVPQEKNEYLINLIIIKTIRFSKEKTQFFHQYIRTLYEELLCWTKKTLNTKTKDVSDYRLYDDSRLSSNKTSNDSKLPSPDHFSQNTNTINLFSCGPPGYKITINVDRNVLEKTTSLLINSEQSHTNKEKVSQISNQTTITRETTSDIINSVPLSTYYNHTSEVTNTFPINNNNDNLTMRTDRQGISRCSITEESGFIRPMTVTPRTENTKLPSKHQSPQSTKKTPQNVGLCFVCGKKTTLLCLGCCKYFYCSIDCQTSDWRTHKLVCKNISNMN